MKAGSSGRASRRKRVRNAAIILLAVIIAVLFVIPPCALCIFLSRHVSYKGTETAKHPMQGIYTAAEFGLEETVHRFETEDGNEVWCAEIKAEQPKGIVIYLSGIVQPSVTYFYGHAAWMQAEGYASFLLEVNSHGSSTGKRIGFGYTETADVRALVDYIKAREEYRDVPVIVQGVSMGGAAALNALGQIEEIDGCIAMSPYASCETEIDLLMKQYGIPGILRSIERPLLTQTLKLMYGKETVEEISPVKQIQNADGRPVFIISCKDDKSVPVENAYILKESCPEAELWIRDSWEHFIVKNCDFRHVMQDSEYCGRVLEMIESIVLQAGNTEQ